MEKLLCENKDILNKLANLDKEIETLMKKVIILLVIGNHVRKDILKYEIINFVNLANGASLFTLIMEIIWIRF